MHRIRAVRDFGTVKAGDLGGWLEKEENLSHDGEAWVGGEAWVTGAALLTKEADYVVLKGFGSVMATATFFRCEDGRIRAKCEDFYGDFYGDMREFRAWAKKSKTAKEYMLIADLIEMHF